MALVVRIEPNGSQALLSHDNVVDDLVAYGWNGFIRQFEGFNLVVAQYFSHNFDSTRAKVGDLQLDLTEVSIPEAIGLSQEGDQWFKNIKIEGVPWNLLMACKKSRWYPKGTPIILFKPRWHGLLLMLKKFIAYEGRYGLVFLYHVRLLMVFLGFNLNMPFYLLRSLQKMAKFYERQKLNP